MTKAIKPTSPEKVDPKKPERSTFWFIIVLVAGCALSLSAIFGGLGMMRLMHSKEEIQTQISKLKELEDKNTLTRLEIYSLVNNEKYIEMIVRRDLGMVKVDEIIYQFPTSSEKNRNN